MTKAVLTEAEVQDYRNQLGDGFLMNSNGVEQLIDTIITLRARNKKLREALDAHFCQCEKPYFGAQRVGIQNCQTCCKCYDVDMWLLLTARES